VLFKLISRSLLSIHLRIISTLDTQDRIFTARNTSNLQFFDTPKPIRIESTLSSSSK